MALTREFRKTIEQMTKQNPSFAKELLKEAATALLNGEPDVLKLLLRDLVNGTIGFERLASEVGIPSKSLHRMLSPYGNPTLANLSLILATLSEHLGLALRAEVVIA